MQIRLIRPDECEVLGEITLRAYRDLTGGESLGPYEVELLDVCARQLDCLCRATRVTHYLAWR